MVINLSLNTRNPGGTLQKWAHARLTHTAVVFWQYFAQHTIYTPPCTTLGAVCRHLIVVAKPENSKDDPRVVAECLGFLRIPV